MPGWVVTVGILLEEDVGMVLEEEELLEEGVGMVLEEEDTVVEDGTAGLVVEEDVVGVSTPTVKEILSLLKLPTPFQVCTNA